MGKYSFNLNYLAKQLDKIIRVKDGKSISYSDVFLKQDLESILVSAYDFNRVIPDSQKLSIIKDGIIKFKSKSTKDGKQLKTQIKKSENDFLKMPLKRFITLSSLSFPYFSKLQNIRLFKGYVSFHRFYPNKFKLTPIHEQLLGYSSSIPPHNYVAVKVHINARNYLEAFTRSSELIDLIRGIWNFSINRRVPKRVRWGARDIINKIRLGPTNSLHDTKGNLVTELLWGDITFQEKSSIWDIKNKWGYISKEFIWIRNVLKKIKYKDDLV